MGANVCCASTKEHDQGQNVNKPPMPEKVSLLAQPYNYMTDDSDQGISKSGASRNAKELTENIKNRDVDIQPTTRSSDGSKLQNDLLR